METNEVSVKELLEGVYQLFAKLPSAKEIKLSTEIAVEIADDSDGHRIKRGYMNYNKFLLITINHKKWAVAFGIPSLDYPSRAYSCDISAVRVSTDVSDEEYVKEVIYLFESGTYFRNSLLFAGSDGNIGLMPYGQFTKKVLDHVRPKAAEFIVKQPEYDPDTIGLDLKTICVSSTKYDPRFSEFLFESFTEVLAQ